MEFEASIQIAKAMLLIALLIFCSVSDLSARRIPNVVLFPALMTSFFFASVANGTEGLVDSVAGMGVGLLMLMPLHVLGRMGAGDIKLLGVVGSILGAWGAIVAGFATMMAGGVLAVIYVVWLLSKPALVAWLGGIANFLTGKRAGSRDAMSLEAVRAAEIPYAVAIAVGSFATIIYLDLLPEVGIL